MKIKDKYIDLKAGYIRFEKYELNWSIYNWSILFDIDFSSEYMLFIRFLCISLIVDKTK